MDGGGGWRRGEKKLPRPRCSDHLQERCPASPCPSSSSSCRRAAKNEEPLAAATTAALTQRRPLRQPAQMFCVRLVRISPDVGMIFVFTICHRIWHASVSSMPALAFNICDGSSCRDADSAASSRSWCRFWLLANMIMIFVSNMLCGTLWTLVHSHIYECNSAMRLQRTATYLFACMLTRVLFIRVLPDSKPTEPNQPYIHRQRAPRRVGVARPLAHLRVQLGDAVATHRRAFFPVHADPRCVSRRADRTLASQAAVGRREQAREDRGRGLAAPPTPR